MDKKIKQYGHQIIVELFKGEHLVPMTVWKETVNAYVRIRFAGSEVRSQTISSNSNPHWNEMMFIQAMLPNHSKFLLIELYDEPTMNDDSLVGTSQIKVNEFLYNQQQQPRWINIYGPPLTYGPNDQHEADIMAHNGYKNGSCYRGRLLIRFSSFDEDDPITKSFPMKFTNPELKISAPAVKSYILRIDVFEGNEQPINDGEYGILHFQFGPYLLKSSKRVMENGKIKWDESIKEMKVEMPVNPKDIPDMIIYFCDEDAESHRMSYTRVNALKFVLVNPKKEKDFGGPKILKFKEDKTLNQVSDSSFPGFAIAKINMHAYTPGKRFEMKNTQKVFEEYFLKLFLYVGRNFPSADKFGSCNPYVQFSIAGRSFQSGVKNSTQNPEWYEMITMPINLEKIIKKPKNKPKQSKALGVGESPTKPVAPKHGSGKSDDDLIPAPSLIILLYHKPRYSGKHALPFSIDTDLLDPKNYDKKKEKILLGRHWLAIDLNKKKRLIHGGDTENTHDICYKKPLWYPIIYDKDDRVDGYFLMSYCLLSKAQYTTVPMPKTITPKGQLVPIFQWVIGVRNISSFQKFNKSSISFNVEIRFGGKIIHTAPVPNEDISFKPGTNQSAKLGISNKGSHSVQKPMGDDDDEVPLMGNDESILYQKPDDYQVESVMLEQKSANNLLSVNKSGQSVDNLNITPQSQHSRQQPRGRGPKGGQDKTEWIGPKPRAFPATTKNLGVVPEEMGKNGEVQDTEDDKKSVRAVNGRYPEEDLEDARFTDTQKCEFDQGGFNINRKFRLLLECPTNSQLCPYLEVFLFMYKTSNLNKKELLAVSSYPMKQVLDFVYEDDADDKYKARWNAFFKLAAQANDEEKGKRTVPEFKITRIHPDNQILYLDKITYVIPHYETKKVRNRNAWKSKNPQKPAVLSDGVRSDIDGDIDPIDPSCLTYAKKPNGDKKQQKFNINESDQQQDNERNWHATSQTPDVRFAPPTRVETKEIGENTTVRVNNAQFLFDGKSEPEQHRNADGMLESEILGGGYGGNNSNEKQVGFRVPSDNTPEGSNRYDENSNLNFVSNIPNAKEELNNIKENKVTQLSEIREVKEEDIKINASRLGSEQNMSPYVKNRNDYSKVASCVGTDGVEYNEKALLEKYKKDLEAEANRDHDKSISVIFLSKIKILGSFKT